MKTDRELLELAAKAGGISGEWCEFTIALSGKHIFGIGNPMVYTAYGDQPWNPLTDDGDALRLMHAIYRKTHSDHWIRIYDNLWSGSLEDMRRAIVRAAAEVGEAMP